MITQLSSSPHPRLFAAIILGGLFYIAGQYVASQPQRIQQEINANREITVQGTGEVVARPDVAKLTLGVVSDVHPTAEAATEALTEKINAVIAAIKNAGIEEKDITTTNLTVNPVYDFVSGQRNQQGFEAQESIEIKVRDTSQVGSLVSLTAQQGANQIGGVQFEIDDPHQLQVEAQEKAITDARMKGEQLADALDVKLGRIKNFEASVNEPPGPPIFARGELAADTAQGNDIEVPSGSQEITATVSITYELR